MLFKSKLYIYIAAPSLSPPGFFLSFWKQDSLDEFYQSYGMVKLWTNFSSAEMNNYIYFWLFTHTEMGKI